MNEQILAHIGEPHAGINIDICKGPISADNIGQLIYLLGPTANHCQLARVQLRLIEMTLDLQVFGHESVEKYLKTVFEKSHKRHL